MSKKIGSKKAQAKQAALKKKAKKKKPSRPAKPAKAQRGKKSAAEKPAAKTSTAVRSARKAAKNSAAVSRSPSVSLASQNPRVETQRPAPVGQHLQQANAATSQAVVLPTPAGAKAENMREGLAFIDQQRVINNLDRKPWGQAPTPTGPGPGYAHEPTNARLVAHHAARLEDELDRGAAAIAAMEHENRQRELLWGLGLARKPRAAVVGRALYELRATSWENASQGKNDRIANQIKIRGPHHLSDTITEVLRTYDSKTSTAAGATLAPLLRRALELLQQYNWLKARTQGVYLDGDGLTLFVDFPDWNRRDEEPGKLRRIRGHRKPS